MKNIGQPQPELQPPGRRVACFRPEDPAIPADDDRRREDADLERLGDGAVAVVDHGKRETVFALEVVDFLQRAGFDGDRDYFGVLCQRVDVTRFGAAGRAPGCPEMKDIGLIGLLSRVIDQAIALRGMDLWQRSMVIRRGAQITDDGHGDDRDDRHHCEFFRPFFPLSHAASPSLL